MCVFCSCFMDQLRIVGVAVAQNLRGANSERKSQPQSQSVSECTFGGDGGKTVLLFI